ncbi:MAG: hypothetical protein HQL70_08485 [Magnetococcales bacterium]|nr:hypothetical protein [Magnetococcales bacterium]
MIKYILSIAMLLLPISLWAGEPPATEAVQKRLQWQRVDKLSPQIVMSGVPKQEKGLLLELTPRIRNRIRQTGFILHRPPEKNYIIGSLERRDISGSNDQLLIKTKPLPPESKLIIHRPGPLLIDPLTDEKMGILSFYIGRLKTQYNTEAGTVAVITDSKQAVIAGDLLMPAPTVEPQLKIHKDAATKMEGRILRIENDQDGAGSSQLFIVGLGRRDWATMGLMLPIYKATQKILDPISKEMVTLPPKTIGHGVLVRIGERASIGFLVDSTHPVQRGDRMATTPK